MSDSDENNGEAIYSDDSDYEQRDSFVSGRNSQSYDGSIVEEPFEFSNNPPIKQNQHKESVYNKKKNVDVKNEEIKAKGAKKED